MKTNDKITYHVTMTVYVDGDWRSQPLYLDGHIGYDSRHSEEFETIEDPNELIEEVRSIALRLLEDHPDSTFKIYAYAWHFNPDDENDCSEYVDLEFTHTYSAKLRASFKSRNAFNPLADYRDIDTYDFDNDLYEYCGGSCMVESEEDAREALKDVVRQFHGIRWLNQEAPEWRYTISMDLDYYLYEDDEEQIESFEYEHYIYFGDLNDDGSVSII